VINNIVCCKNSSYTCGVVTFLLWRRAGLAAIVSWQSRTGTRSPSTHLPILRLRTSCVEWSKTVRRRFEISNRPLDLDVDLSVRNVGVSDMRDGARFHQILSFYQGC